MDRLASAHERLDGPLDDPHLLDGNLRDLARVNRWLGGSALSRRAVGSLVRDRGGPIALLDVGTGAADIPVSLLSGGDAWTRRLEITAVDARQEVIAAAARVTPGARDNPRLTLVVADGGSLPFADDAFDVAHASLVLHHLDRPGATDLLREMARVSRRGVVVNDLARGRLAFLGAWLLAHALTSNAYTRNDAPLSVRRAWRPDEVHGLLGLAGLRPVQTWHGILRHRYAIAAVRR